MNYIEIEKLKGLFAKMSSRRATLRCDELQLEGRIISIGYKPIWTERMDTMIEKLEFHCMDRYGNIIPLNIHHVIGYDLLKPQQEREGGLDSMDVELHVFSMNRTTEKEPYDKLHMTITID